MRHNLRRLAQPQTGAAAQHSRAAPYVDGRSRTAPPRRLIASQPSNTGVLSTPAPALPPEEQPHKRQLSLPTRSANSSLSNCSGCLLVGMWVFHGELSAAPSFHSGRMRLRKGCRHHTRTFGQVKVSLPLFLVLSRLPACVSSLGLSRVVVAEPTRATRYRRMHSGRPGRYR